MVAEGIPVTITQIERERVSILRNRLELTQHAQDYSYMDSKTKQKSGGIDKR